ncbi:MAG: hypothetical protein UD936_11035, partial [Acutalibacteraceae bacterium]|nr:hypothetical protein [Acutalibacteraceae bacterium]
AYVSGCLGYVAEVVTVENPLTGDVMDVYKVEWKYFNPRTGETTLVPLTDENGEIVTVADAYWEYEKVALNPYFDLDYDHVNDAEIPTEKAPATLPPAPTQSATDATNATKAPAANNSSNGTVNTAGNTVVVTLALVLLAAVSVTAFVRKREEA